MKKSYKDLRLLGVKDWVEGDEKEIRAAYKSALACHPDRFADADDAAAEAEAKFKELGEALDILTDEFKRKLWDEANRRDRAARANAGAAAG